MTLPRNLRPRVLNGDDETGAPETKALGAGALALIAATATPGASSAAAEPAALALCW